MKEVSVSGIFRNVALILRWRTNKNYLSTLILQMFWPDLWLISLSLLAQLAQSLVSSLSAEEIYVDFLCFKMVWLRTVQTILLWFLSKTVPHLYHLEDWPLPFFWNSTINYFTSECEPNLCILMGCECSFVDYLGLDSFSNPASCLSKAPSCNRITLVSTRVAVTHYLITLHLCMTCVYMLYCLIEFSLLVWNQL